MTENTFFMAWEVLPGAHTPTELLLYFTSALKLIRFARLRDISPMYHTHTYIPMRTGIGAHGNVIAGNVSRNIDLNNDKQKLAL